MNFLNQAINKAKEAVHDAKDAVTGTETLTESQIKQALSEALETATTRAVTIVAALDGYFANPLIRIPMPPQLATLHSVLSKLPGLDKLLDDFVLSMNRAAERAAHEAAAIFGPVIRQLTFSKTFEILQGDEHAATRFFEEHTRMNLQQRFLPVVNESMNHTGVVSLWDQLTAQINKVPLITVPVFGLAEYVTQQALNGLFTMLGVKESEIRRTPAARATPVMAKVFQQCRQAQETLSREAPDLSATPSSPPPAAAS
jgi:hypothetical protein